MVYCTAVQNINSVHIKYAIVTLFFAHLMLQGCGLKFVTGGGNQPLCMFMRVFVCMHVYNMQKSKCLGGEGVQPPLAMPM